MSAHSDGMALFPAPDHPIAYDAHLYDGESAARRPVRVVRDGDGLVLTHADNTQERIPWALIRLADSHADTLALKRTDRFGWRLTIDAAPAWASELRHHDSLIGWARAQGWRRLAAGVVVIGGLGWLVGTRFVDWIVPLLPQTMTRALGEKVVAQMGAPGTCTAPAALADLNDLARRLYPGMPAVRVQVLDQPVVNAFAAPGGQLALFRGLIADAKNSDELAGVLAHELGHAYRQHPERSLVRAFGIGLFLSSFGGDVGQAADTLMALSNSRDYEREADAEAIRALARINASPAGIASFFERMAGADKVPNGIARAMTYLSTHPDLKERAQRARAALVAGHSYRPALDATAWARVQVMCGPEKNRNRARAQPAPALPPPAQPDATQPDAADTDRKGGA